MTLNKIPLSSFLLFKEWNVIRGFLGSKVQIIKYK